jgi:hypothetical protein
MGAAGADGEQRPVHPRHQHRIVAHLAGQHRALDHLAGEYALGEIGAAWSFLIVAHGVSAPF